MGTLTAGCCVDDSCWTLPPEFVRVKYFYGQRLGVMELSDEAAYHAGKHAFHNVRAHGAGVLCGLGVDLFVQTPGAATTVLRVRRGAALDECGREVVVGCDQCVDVAAWYAANKGRPELSDWTPGTSARLYVAARYRECPSDPCAAPRDPCGCDNSGAEFGRVREGFELGLLTSKETGKLRVREFPPGAFVQKIVAAASSFTHGSAASAVEAAIDRIVAAACPAPDDSRWLALAEVKVTLDATTGAPTSLGAPDLTLAERVSLLTTSALQSIVLDLLTTGVGSGAIGDGPRAGALSFTASGAAAGTLHVPVTLAEGGSPSTPQALVGPSIQGAAVTLEQVDAGAATGWDAVPIGAVTYSASPSRIAIPVTSGLSPYTAGSGPVYRLTIAAPLATPIVDVLGRPLTPAPYTRTFGFRLDANSTLTLATTL